jgi:hypothetical protein
MVDETFDILGQDFLLAPVNDGTGDNYYDLVLENGDIKMVSGTDAINNDVKLKLLTVWGEMQNNPTYQAWGNHASEELRKNNTQLTQTAIKQDFINAITESSRVKTLDLINVDFTLGPPMMGVDVLFIFTCMDDQAGGGSVSLS